MLANYVPPTLYDDATILVMLNDAYLECCERTHCLKALSTVTLVAGQGEYDLPSDFSAIDSVVAAGVPLFAVPLSDALRDQPTLSTPQAGYYTYAGKIGFLPVPNQIDGAVSTMIAYNAKPAPFLTYDDGFDSRFPVEYADILLHYVIWRVQSMSGGAESLRNAQINRNLNDNRMKELRRSVNNVGMLQPSQLPHVGDNRRIRSRSAL
jgi:hypothetical protein